MKLIIALLLLVSMPTWAGEWHGVLHGLSKHSTDVSRHGKPWNERNFGLGIRYEQSADWSYQGGAYHNSERHTSVYGLVDWTPIEIAALRLGVSAGVVTGYETAPVVPAATLVARLQAKRVSIVVRYLPPISPKLTSVAAVELAWRF